MENKTEYIKFTKPSGKKILIKKENVLYIEEVDTVPGVSTYRIYLNAFNELKIISINCKEVNMSDLMTDNVMTY